MEWCDAGILLMSTYVSKLIYSHEFRDSMRSSDIKRTLGVKLLLLHTRSQGGAAASEQSAS